MKKQLLSERELDEIRGKMLVNAATQEELHDFLTYVSKLEGLLIDADNEDFFGSEGYRHRLGWD